MTILGITGKLGSGKDTVGAILVEQYGYQRVAFADALKNLAYDLNPIVFEHTTDEGLCSVRLQEFVDSQGWETAKRDNPEIRRTLQALGVAARDNLDPDVWVKVVAEDIDSLEGDGYPVVITDVRFPNEARMILYSGGQVYRVERPGFDGDGHATETALDKYEFPTIDNSGTIDELRLIVGDIVAGTAV